LWWMRLGLRRNVSLWLWFVRAPLSRAPPVTPLPLPPPPPTGLRGFIRQHSKAQWTESEWSKKSRVGKGARDAWRHTDNGIQRGRREEGEVLTSTPVTKLTPPFFPPAPHSSASCQQIPTFSSSTTTPPLPSPTTTTSSSHQSTHPLNNALQTLNPRSKPTTPLYTTPLPLTHDCTEAFSRWASVRCACQRLQALLYN